jgi:hypothetical protein
MPFEAVKGKDTIPLEPRTAVAKFLVDFELAYAQKAGHADKTIAQSRTRFLLWEKQVREGNMFLQHNGISAALGAGDILPKTDTIAKTYAQQNQTDEGKQAVFQELLRWKNIVLSNGIALANEYLSIKLIMDTNFPGRDLASLTQEDLSFLDGARHAYRFIPEPAEQMYNKRFFDWKHMYDLSEGDFALLATIGRNQSPHFQEAFAFIGDYETLARGQLMGAYLISRFSPKDILTGESVVLSEYARWQENPQTYQEALPYSRKLPESLVAWKEQGILSQGYPEYTLSDTLRDPATGMLPAVVKFLLPQGVEDPGYKSFEEAAEIRFHKFGDIPTEQERSTFLKQFELKFKMLQVRMLKYAIDVFSEAKESLHPEIEKAVRGLVLYMVTGGEVNPNYLYPRDMERDELLKGYYDANTLFESTYFIRRIAQELKLPVDHLAY